MSNTNLKDLHAVALNRASPRKSPQRPCGLHSSHPDCDPDDLSYREGPPKCDPGVPQSKPTRYYDGFNGFTYPGTPARLISMCAIENGRLHFDNS